MPWRYNPAERLVRTCTLVVVSNAAVVSDRTMLGELAVRNAWSAVNPRSAAKELVVVANLKL